MSRSANPLIPMPDPTQIRAGLHHLHIEPLLPQIMQQLAPRESSAHNHSVEFALRKRIVQREGVHAVGGRTVALGVVTDIATDRHVSHVYQSSTLQQKNTKCGRVA